jgi:hypothetical protein
MRTTLTLDPDVVKLLKEEQHQTRRSFKEVVNQALRRGLSQDAKPTRRPPRFKVRARHCGFRPGVDPDRLNQLVDQLEAADFAAESSTAYDTTKD